MINTFKENDNKSSIDNILQNKDDYKLLSKVAYKKHQNNIENAIQHTNYKYDPSLSSQTEKVFYNPNTKETVISHAGTNFGSKKWYNDLRSDNAILWGLEKQDKQFKNAQSHLDKVKNKYGDNITVTGHSLGGSISEQLARSNPNVNSIAFNRGSGPLQSFRKRPKNLIDVSNRNDPISYFSRSRKGKRQQNIINNKRWHSI